MKLLTYELIMGMAFEAITLILKFYFGLESTRDTASIGSFTGGIRIPHGYIGVLMMLIAFFSMRQTGDFWVLWTLTGDPQFDLVYPDA